MRLNQEKGSALLATMFLSVIMLTYSGLFLLRTVQEKNMVTKDQQATQSFYVSESGMNDALYSLNQLINVNLRDTVRSTQPQRIGNQAAAYANSNDSLGFLVDFAEINNAEQFTLSADGTEAVNSNTVNFANGTYQYTINVSQKTNPVQITSNIWDFVYDYTINSSGAVSGISRAMSLTGDFTVRVQRDNFAKYALFTDHHALPSGTTVWFTNSTDFAGPIHTNERFSFAFNPAGIFDGEVTQQNTRARFYNNGRALLRDADSNGTRDVPVFNEGFERGAGQIVLQSSVQKNDMADQAKGGATITGNGIFVPNDGANLTGGIFVRGNPNISMGVDAQGNAAYTIQNGSDVKVVTVDRVNETTSVLDNTAGTTDTYDGLPEGLDGVGTLFYVDGNVNSLSGTVQRDTEVTVASEFDIVIADHIQYQDFDAAVGSPGDVNYQGPNADGADNLLGILSWGGDVRIGSTAPDNLNIHGVVMAKNGLFTVDNYTDRSRGGRGTTTLLGGAITQFYGAFGLFNGRTGQFLSGYGRNFVYDSRTEEGRAPPYFPYLDTFTAASTDIRDNLIWQEGGF